MTKQYQPWEPRQSYLLPPSPLDWLPGDHLVFFILDVIGQLDLSAIEGKIHDKDPRGQRPYSPVMMTALLLYGYCVGIRSSRRLERATYEDVPFRVLTAGAHPDPSRINEFRRVHLRSIEGLFVQVLRLCQASGLARLGHVSLDGTKMKGNTSKHKAMSYERMLKSEAELAAEVAAMLREAEEIDQAEDERYGKDRRGDELPEELHTREGRLKKIREAKAKLEAEAAAARARELSKQADDAEREAEQAAAEDEERSKKRAARTRQKAEAAADHARQKATETGEPEPDLEPRDRKSVV